MANLVDGGGPRWRAIVTSGVFVAIGLVLAVVGIRSGRASASLLGELAFSLCVAFLIGYNGYHVWRASRSR
jgi:hypothetical protein